MSIRRSAGDTTGIHDGDKQPQIRPDPVASGPPFLPVFRSLWPTPQWPSTSCFNALSTLKVSHNVRFTHDLFLLIFIAAGLVKG